MFINLVNKIVSKIKTFPLRMFPIIGICLAGSMVIHEIGHWTACTLLGSPSFITITLIDSYATCLAVPSHTSQLISVAGGALSVGVFAVLLGVKLLNRYRSIRIALLAAIITQSINMLVEGFFPQIYGDVALVLIPATGVILTILLELYVLDNQIPQSASV